MTDEDYEAQQEFVHPYIDDLKPIGPVELQLARIIALDNFRLNRLTGPLYGGLSLHAVEENLFTHGETAATCQFEAEDHRIHHAVSQVKVFAAEGKTFHNLSLYEQEERLNTKTKPLTHAASTGNKPNGFDFSTALAQTKEAPIAPPKAA